MKNINYLCSVVTILVVASCSRGKYFSFKNVEFLTEFPVEYVPENPEVLDVNVMGVQGIKVFDDFILVACTDSDGCLSAFDKDGKRLSRSFLKIGRGPGEVLYKPFISWFDFYRSGTGNILAGIYDNKGKYIEYDITASIVANVTRWRCLADSLRMDYGPDYSLIADDKFMCRRVKENRGGYERYIVDGRSVCSCNQAMEYLNSFSSAELNMYSTAILVNNEKSLVAELGSRLNVVHVYSLTSHLAKTISLKNHLEDVNAEESKEPDQMCKIYYDAEKFDDYFVGLYVGDTFENLDRGSFRIPQLHFFSWEGKPLAKLQLPTRALSFAIDQTEGELYLVEYNTEKILRYDISDFLRQIHGKVSTIDN